MSQLLTIVCRTQVSKESRNRLEKVRGTKKETSHLTLITEEERVIICCCQNHTRRIKKSGVVKQVELNSMLDLIFCYRLVCNKSPGGEKQGQLKTSCPQGVGGDCQCFALFCFFAQLANSPW